jgi:hypothetical protein
MHATSTYHPKTKTKYFTDTSLTKTRTSTFQIHNFTFATATKANTPHACYCFRRVCKVSQKISLFRDQRPPEHPASNLDLVSSDYHLFSALGQTPRSRHKFKYDNEKETIVTP